MLPKLDSCQSCKGWAWGKQGFVPATGTGDNGILLIAEAAGENEALAGEPLIGKAGYFLFQQLARVGIERDGFRIHNVLSCQPPLNKLAKMPYELDVIQSCAPNLDATIASHKEHCLKVGKNPVIVTSGKIAFKRVMNLTDQSPVMDEEYRGYPFWNEKYGCWVFATDHPSYLMRGAFHLVPVLQFTFKRAFEVASEGLEIERVGYDLDPTPEQFQQWADAYLDNNPWDGVLSYDIETPYKQGEDEDNLETEGDDFTILRCSFCSQPGKAVSVPWNADYMPTIKRLFDAPYPKVGWNSRGYDDERILAQIPMRGDRIDAMPAWHILNSALPKGLGFVTPYYWQNTGMWKHLSGVDPQFYNAKDADAALRCWLGIAKNLKENNQWHVFERHCIKLNRIFDYMSLKGVPRDEEMRSKAEATLTGILEGIKGKMEANIPSDAKKTKVYKKIPKQTEGMILVDAREEVRRCSICGVQNPTKPHFKIFKKKDNPCAGGVVIKVEEAVKKWAKPLEWKISKVGLLSYQKTKQHLPVFDRKKDAITFDEKAMMRLIKLYPSDVLYPLILDFRGNQKLLSTYIGVTQIDGSTRGGMPIGTDGRIHTTFGTDPSTLRSSSRNPNLQNLPRPTKNKDDLSNIIRNLIMAGTGSVFTARDYSGIEAVLVGYEAQSERYMRLAKIDVHSFYTAYALHELDGRVRSSELPLLSWGDDKLKASLADLKDRFKEDRNSLYKHLVHGANFMQGAEGARQKIYSETGIEYELALVKRVMSIYFELFPEIKKWHREELLRAEDNGYVRNAFGYVHRFSKVFEYEMVGGKWEKYPGPQANQVIAFKPQSNAAGIIKEAMLRLYYDRFEEAGQYLRLLVHDELFSEVPEASVDRVDGVMQEEMEKPVPELNGLVILTEAKKGLRWGMMC